MMYNMYLRMISSREHESTFPTNFYLSLSLLPHAFDFPAILACPVINGEHSGIASFCEDSFLTPKGVILYFYH